MKRNLTELVFIVDRSGSMGGLESDTIVGFNAIVKKDDFRDKSIVILTKWGIRYQKSQFDLTGLQF